MCSSLPSTASTPVQVANADVLVVAPALNSRLRRWLSDEDGARRKAAERVSAWVDRLQQTGARVQGRVGDADPLQAIADALPTFPADEIVIVAQSDARTGSPTSSSRGRAAASGSRSAVPARSSLAPSTRPGRSARE